MSVVAEVVRGRKARTETAATSRRQQIAMWMILVSDGSFLPWGGMAALEPERLLGPHGKPIVTAGYEGFTRESWSALVSSSPHTAAYITLVFRVYGVYGVVFGFLAVAIAVTAFRRGERWAWWTLLIANTVAYAAAMSYDRIVNAIGPFELTEYLGIAVVYVALAMTASPVLGRRSAAHRPM